MQFGNKPVKLVDCFAQSGARELLIVEGDSASLAVIQVRDAKHQAVLPMQGKPMNAYKASAEKLLANPLFSALTQALGLVGLRDGEKMDITHLRYEKVVLLMDPDADGIHCAALMQLFFYRWLPDIYAAGRLQLVFPPVGELALLDSDGNLGNTEYAYSEAAFLTLCDNFKAKKQAFHPLKYRGLGGIPQAVLARTCVEVASRHAITLKLTDAEMVLEVFGKG